MSNANILGFFSATVNGTAGGTGPDTVTQQEGPTGLGILTYTDVGTGSYTLKFNKVLDPSEFFIMCWNQTVDAAGKSNITWTVATDTVTVKSFAVDAVTATDCIFSIMVIPLKN